MKTKFSFALILFALFVFPHTIRAERPSEKSRVVKVVKTFYKFHFGHDSDFSDSHFEQMKKFLTIALSSDFTDSLKERNEFLRKNGMGKTMFERYGFEPMTEACKYVYKVGKGSIKGASATVEVHFGDSKKCQYYQRDAGWTYKIELTKNSGEWLISGISEDNL